MVGVHRGAVSAGADFALAAVRLLPAGFQTSEFLLKHGLVDQIVARTEMRDRIGELLLALHVKKKAAPPTTVVNT